MLAQYLPETIFAFFLVFARLGAAIMVVPGFGEGFVTPRARLAIALSMSFLVLPFVEKSLPPLPGNPLALTVPLLIETVIGLFIGGTARMAITGLHVAGAVIAYNSSLAAAQFFDPTQQSQGALIGSFMTILGLVLIFVTDLHHLFLMGIFESYDMLPPATLPPIENMAGVFTDFVANSFTLGIQISAPFLVYGLTFYIGIGLVNRLMPQMQVFFVVMPLQIALAFFFLMLTVGGGMVWFLGYYENALISFLKG